MGYSLKKEGSKIGKEAMKIAFYGGLGASVICTLILAIENRCDYQRGISVSTWSVIALTLVSMGISYWSLKKKWIARLRQIYLQQVYVALIASAFFALGLYFYMSYFDVEFFNYYMESQKELICNSEKYSEVERMQLLQNLKNISGFDLSLATFFHMGFLGVLVPLLTSFVLYYLRPKKA